MSHNAKSLEIFVQNAIKEANAAAQKVFDMYQMEFESRVLAQLNDGDKLSCGMGIASVTTAKGKDISYDNEFIKLLTQLQYPYQDLNASFDTPDMEKPIKAK